MGTMETNKSEHSIETFSFLVVNMVVVVVVVVVAVAAVVVVVVVVAVVVVGCCCCCCCCCLLLFVLLLLFVVFSCQCLLHSMQFIVTPIGLGHTSYTHSYHSAFYVIQRSSFSSFVALMLVLQ